MVAVSVGGSRPGMDISRQLQGSLAVTIGDPGETAGGKGDCSKGGMYGCHLQYRPST